MNRTRTLLILILVKIQRTNLIDSARREIRFDRRNSGIAKSNEIKPGSYKSYKFKDIN
jgi:hypothetical protein